MASKSCLRASLLARVATPTLLTLSLFLSSCSSERLMPPEEIDNGTRVSAIAPMEELTPETQAGYPGQAPVAGSSDYLDTPQIADQSSEIRRQPLAAPGQQSRRLLMIDSPEADALQPGYQQAGVLPQGGVDMDEGLGVAPVQGLAEAQAVEIAEGNATQPVVGNIGTDDPTMLSTGLPQPEWQPQPIARGAPPSTLNQQVAMIRPENPVYRVDAPQSSPAVMRSSEISCRRELASLCVKFADKPAISNGPTCGIPWPIEVRGFASGIQMRPAIKLNCQVTLAFAKWVKNELNPSARLRYWSGVKTIIPLGGYSCRRMNSSKRNPWSEHARGNAIDVGKFVLNSGKTIDVRKKSIFAFRERGLLNAVRDDSCKYFHTVLGPGSDPHHKDHFHFDLRARKSGYRHCD